VINGRRLQKQLHRPSATVVVARLQLCHYPRFAIFLNVAPSTGKLIAAYFTKITLQYKRSYDN